MYLTTDALVLRETAYKENSKLLTVLTRQNGLLTLKARGVGGKTSKLKAACQLLAFSEFTVHERNGYYTIYEANLKELFPALRKNLEFLSLGSYFAQLSETVAQEDFASPELLPLILGALYALCYQKRPLTLVKAGFELRLLCIAGYAPDLTACSFCGEEQAQSFSPTLGKLLCESCHRRTGQTAIQITPGTLDAIRYITQTDLKSIFSFSLGDKSIGQLALLAETYLLTQLDRSFPALDFYKSILL